MCGGTGVGPDAIGGGGDGDGGGTATDTDGDGVDNDSDNCAELANANQHNEDSDKFGDVCDPCPTEANDTPSDPDGDGVADGCDPLPDSAGNQIVLFEGFGAGVPGGWLNSGATMVGDDVRLVATGTTEKFISPPLDATTKMMVMTRVVIEETTGNNDADFGVVIPYNPQNDARISCELYSPTATSTNNRDVSIWDSIGDATVGAQQFAWVINVPYLLSMRRDGSSYTCRASGPNGTAATASGNSSSVPAQQKIALRAYAASTLISYVLIVTSP